MKITGHLPGWAVFNDNISVDHFVGDKKIPDVDMSSALAARCPPIPCQQHGALIVLEHGVSRDGVSLRLEEELGPQNLWYSIVNSNQIGFRGASGVDSLFGG